MEKNYILLYELNNVNKIKNNGNTNLICAVQNNDISYGKLLLKNIADSNIKNNDNLTSLISLNMIQI